MRIYMRTIINGNILFLFFTKMNNIYDKNLIVP